MELSQISKAVQAGDANRVQELINSEIEKKTDVEKILNEGLLHGMNIIGKKFKENEVFIPEVLIAARAMSMGMDILEPHLVDASVKPAGRAVIGTVKGDLHDIGKNLLGMMLKGAGIEVIDAGVDVSSEKFIEIAEKENADIICLSALLTTTMPQMEDVIQKLKEKGLRERYVVMIGGAPVSEVYGEQIGADYYRPDASSAAETAREALQNKQTA